MGSCQNNDVPNLMEIEKTESFSSKFSGTEPLGFILLASGTLCPFGLFPPATEADALGDPLTWKEIKMSPPNVILTSNNKGTVVCPAEFCQEKITKKLSIESHLKKHISQIMMQQEHERLKSTAIIDVTPAAVLYLPKIPIKYYCNAMDCSYRYTVSDGSRYFTRLKYLKQHFFKVHAPKTFTCDSCLKTFSTVVFLDIHKRMCGNSFDCLSCKATYTSLEALQTHCRRKTHLYNHEKYKDLFNTIKQETEKKKAEEILKQKLAAVTLTSPTPTIIAKTVNHFPILIPRPKTVTLCGPGGGTSHVTWTYENGTETPKLKVEMSTQTMQETEELVNESSPKNNFSSQGSRQTKRKKSAETQTGKIRYRISTETQTSNVTKRRRCSKKQIAEAETQCPVLEPLSAAAAIHTSENKVSCKTDASYSGSWTDKSTSYQSSALNLPMPSTESSVYPAISLPLIMSIVGIDGDSELENVSSSLTQTMEANNNNFTTDVETKPVATTSSVMTSEMCVGNRYDEVAQQLFDFEEFHRETQTDSDWVTPMNNIFDDIIMYHTSVAVDGAISNLLNLTTAETQTWTGVSPPRNDFTSTSTSVENNSFTIFEDPNVFCLSRDQLGPEVPYEDYTALSAHSCSRNNSPSFLETVDNETQTPMLVDTEFDELMSRMGGTTQVDFSLF